MLLFLFFLNLYSEWGLLPDIVSYDKAGRHQSGIGDALKRYKEMHWQGCFVSCRDETVKCNPRSQVGEMGMHATLTDISDWPLCNGHSN